MTMYCPGADNPLKGPSAPAPGISASKRFTTKDADPKSTKSPCRIIGQSRPELVIRHSPLLVFFVTPPTPVCKSATKNPPLAEARARDLKDFQWAPGGPASASDCPSRATNLGPS